VRWTRFFAYVIIDTPPVNAVTDALILAAHANGTILVVEQGRTTCPALKRAQQMLERVRARTLRAVMNKVRASSGAYGYDSGYDSGSTNGVTQPTTNEGSEPRESSRLA
jgi:protein-tyrosine kinase